MTDGAECVLNNVITALKQVFAPDSSHPPLGGGTEKVRVFAGEAAPLSAVDLHLADEDCACGQQPFLWVRLVRRYRSRAFPQPYVGDDPCGSPVVVAVEIGVARCAVMFSDSCEWEDYANEAEVSLDDSWRIELALCRAATLMKRANCSDVVAFDSIIPYGPEGGVIAWYGTLYARLDT